MLGNIVDHRTNRTTPLCDAVFEPSAHDQARDARGAELFSYDEATADARYFYVSELPSTTVREAILHAEATWPFAVTVFLYDRGSRPLG
ncbi:MAG: hypothetical protein ABIL01_11955 [Pseudomonadota bacterium]